MNGPTRDQGELPAFDWRRAAPALPHQGQPSRFDFEFERVGPSPEGVLRGWERCAARGALLDVQ